MNDATPGAEPSIPTDPATTTTTQQQQTITITNSNTKTIQRPIKYTQRTARKKNPNRKEIHKKAGIKVVIDKIVDYACMTSQRDHDTETNAVSGSTVHDKNNQEQTSTTTTENQQDDNSSDAEVQQLLYDYRCFKEEIQETIHDEDYNDINEVDPNRESEYKKEVRSEAEVQQSLSDPQSF